MTAADTELCDAKHSALISSASARAVALRAVCDPWSLTRARMIKIVARSGNALGESVLWHTDESAVYIADTVRDIEAGAP